MIITTTSRALTALVVGGTVVLSACAGMSQKTRGAVIGATTGAAVGGVVGNQTGSTARGAIIGAVIGGAAGAIIGHQMDQQAKELEQNIPGATIQRVGEGIAVTFSSGILYPFNSTEILPAGKQNLQELANSLEKYPNSDVLIVGHTDSVGTDAYNLDLSQRRALAASAYLQSLGVPASRLKTAGKGESEPIQPNDTDEGRARNRRVEIAIYASEAYRNQVKGQTQ
ncbi:MAG TPA: OmpA family protein [Gemmatimonadaceae bacterium]|nr:OmpA family protein [Gemmatimonadaceae bacterium]